MIDKSIRQHYQEGEKVNPLLKMGEKLMAIPRKKITPASIAKGIVKREVMEVLSPGTALSDKYLEQKENNYLCAVTLEKRKCGIAILDHSTGEFYTCSRDNVELLTLLKQFYVSDILCQI